MEGNSNHGNKKYVVRLMSVPSIGELTAHILCFEGYDTLDKIEDAGEDMIGKIEGIGEEKVNSIFKELRGTVKDSPDVTSEFRCPDCDTVVTLSKEICPECDKRFSELEEQVILPGGIILDDPIETLCEYDVKIASGEDDENVWFGRGAILESMGSYQKAYESYDKVIEFDPLFDQIWNAKARLAMKLGKMDEAARVYKIAVDFRVEGGHDLDKMFTQEEEEPEPPKKEHSVDVREVEEAISTARKAVSELSGLNGNIAHLRGMLSDASKARNTDSREEAIKIADEIVDAVSVLKEAMPRMEKLEDLLTNVDEEIAVEFEDRYEELMSMIDGGAYDEVFDTATKIMDDIEEAVEAKERSAPEVEEPEEPILDETIFEEHLAEARSSLAEARNTKINIDKIKHALRDALQTKKEGSLEDAYEYVQKVQEYSDKILSIFDKLNEGKELILEMKDSGFDYKPHLEKLKKVKGSADEGSYDEAFSLLDQEIKVMKRTLKSEVEAEDVVVDESEVEAEDVVVDEPEVEAEDVEVDESELDIEEQEEKLDVKKPQEMSVEEKHELTDRISRSIADLKKYITIARSNEVDVGKAGEMINKAMISTNNGKSREALVFLEKGLDYIKSSMDERLDEDISKVEKTMEGAEEGDHKKKAMENIEEARSAHGSGHYNSAFQHLSLALKMSEKAKTEYQKTMDRILSIEELMKDSQVIGVDIGDSLDKINDAKERLKEDDLEEAIDLAEKAKTILMESLSDELKRVMKQAKEELQEAKLSGKNVSRPIFLLKKVKVEGSENELQDSVQYLKKYREVMKKMTAE